MKREFLQKLEVGGQPMPKEMIDAILDENSRDIGAVKKRFGDYDAIKEQLGKAQQVIETMQSRDQDMETALEAARSWEKKYNEAQQQHQAELTRIAFDHTLEAAVARAKGRSMKAITAMLDMDALRASEDSAAAIDEALDSLKKDSGYLFETAQLPPLYARGTGAVTGAIDEAPVTLAGALRERFEKERK